VVKNIKDNTVHLTGSSSFVISKEPYENEKCQIINWGGGLDTMTNELRSSESYTVTRRNEIGNDHNSVGIVSSELTIKQSAPHIVSKSANAAYEADSGVSIVSDSLTWNKVDCGACVKPKQISSTAGLSSSYSIRGKTSALKSSKTIENIFKDCTSLDSQQCCRKTGSLWSDMTGSNSLEQQCSKNLTKSGGPMTVYGELVIDCAKMNFDSFE